MKLSDFNLVRKKEVDAIKTDIDELRSKLDEILICLPQREQAILDAIEAGKANDLATATLIKEQEKAIAKLEEINFAKTKTLTGLTRWLILGALGILSMTVQYDINYSRGEGVVITPSSDTGALLPLVYSLAIVAIATGQDSKVGNIIDKLGEKIG